MRDGAEKQQQMEASVFFSHVNMSKVIIKYDVAIKYIATAIDHTTECTLEDEVNDESVSQDKEEIETTDREDKSNEKIDLVANKPDAVVESVPKPSKGRGRPKSVPLPSPLPEGDRRGPARPCKSDREKEDGQFEEGSRDCASDDIALAPSVKRKPPAKRKAAKAGKKTGMVLKNISFGYHANVQSFNNVAIV